MRVFKALRDEKMVSIKDLFISMSLSTVCIRQFFIFFLILVMSLDPCWNNLAKRSFEI